MNKPAVSALEPLGFPWKGVDPFLICSYHNDTYPAGNDRFGPAASLEGRQIGEDFTGRDGWPPDPAAQRAAASVLNSTLVYSIAQ